jgi:hypothetical protein
MILRANAIFQGVAADVRENAGFVSPNDDIYAQSTPRRFPLFALTQC